MTKMTESKLSIKLASPSYYSSFLILSVVFMKRSDMLYYNPGVNIKNVKKKKQRFNLLIDIITTSNDVLRILYSAACVYDCFLIATQG